MKVTQEWFAMKLEQERLRNLLTDTIILLCNNGLKYKHELRVEGLIGITVDSEEVFLVHLNENRRGKDAAVGGQVHSTTSGERDGHISSESENSQTAKRRRKRKSTPSHLSLKEVEVDPEASTSTLNSTLFPLLKIKKENENFDCNTDRESRSAPIDLHASKLQPIEDSSVNHKGKNMESDISCMVSNSLTPLSNQGNWLEGEPQSHFQLFPEWSQQSLHSFSMAQQIRMSTEFTTDLTHCTPRRPRNGLKPFSCPLPFCAKSFYYKHHLKRHIRLKHKEYIQVVPPVYVPDAETKNGPLRDLGQVDLTGVAMNLMQSHFPHASRPPSSNEDCDDFEEDKIGDDLGGQGKNTRRKETMKAVPSVFEPITQLRSAPMKDFGQVDLTGTPMNLMQNHFPLTRKAPSSNEDCDDGGDEKNDHLGGTADVVRQRAPTAGKGDTSMEFEQVDLTGTPMNLKQKHFPQTRRALTSMSKYDEVLAGPEDEQEDGEQNDDDDDDDDEVFSD